LAPSSRGARALAGIVVLALLLAVTALAPALAPHDPLAQDLVTVLPAPSASHPLGTDDLGRDILSRLLSGGRLPFVIGFGSAAILLLSGIAVGAVAGYAAGWIDNALMRVVDVVLAFPVFFLLLIVAAYSGETVVTPILFIGLFNWMYLARLVRAEFLVLRHADYVAAARATGVGGWRLMWRHLLPHALAPIIVNATFSIAVAMCTEAALDVLGVGLPAATPTWGTMLAAAEQYMAVIPLQTIAPGLVLMLAILAINVVGGALTVG
jgi:peptide/nickel transport system permease protein